MLNIHSRLKTSCLNFMKEGIPPLRKVEEETLRQLLKVKRQSGEFRVVADPIEQRFNLQPKKPGSCTVQDKLAAHLQSLDYLNCSDMVITRRKPLACRLGKEFLSSQIQDVAVNGLRMQPLAQGARRRVVVDFSSPNIAKELHVGHLRSTVIGDSLAHILEFCGHDVLRQNHVGDWGTQFGMLITLLLEKHPELRDCDSASKLNITLQELQSNYQAAKERFDSCEQFKKDSLAAVVRLQDKQQLELHLWNKICDVSRDAYNDIYRRLGVSTTERGESFYAPFIPDMLKHLESQGAITADDFGRRIVLLPGFKVPLILVKSDGGYTYAATDMAAIWHRINVVKADWLVYVVDSGQSLHFKSIFAAARRFGICPDTVRLDHVAFGLVTGADGKRIKTRSGDSVKLAELLDEAQQRAYAVIADRTDFPSEEAKLSVRDSIAYACIRYADLRLPSNLNYAFDFDSMLDMHGDTAVYMMYMLARLRSINLKVNMTDEEVAAEASKQAPDLEHPLEQELASVILGFPHMVEEQVSLKLAPHHICVYLGELSRAFTAFYMQCYVVDSDPATKEVLRVHMSRVVLCKAAGDTMRKCLALLGVRPQQGRM
eukprot:scpid22578/ scgid33112/ Arginine--tRNA ligase, cytoplasmic; Arginyl-tRNA synthetase